MGDNHAAEVQAELQHYLSSKNINSLFIQIVESLLIEKPDNPIAFMVEYLLKSFPNETRDFQLRMKEGEEEASVRKPKEETATPIPTPIPAHSSSSSSSAAVKDSHDHSAVPVTPAAERERLVEEVEREKHIAREEHVAAVVPKEEEDIVHVSEDKSKEHHKDEVSAPMSALAVE